MSLQIAKLISLSQRKLAFLFCGTAILAIGPVSAETLTVYNDATGDGYLSFEQDGGICDEIFWNSEMQTEDGEAIGIGSGRCTQIDDQKNFFCSFVINLDDRGIIAGQGVQRTEPLESIYPITGGNGEFDGITGTIKSQPVEDRARFIFEIEY